MFASFSKKEVVEKADIVTNTEACLEGWLMKTNSKGERKLRFCVFTDDCFKTCKPDKHRPVLTDDIKENFSVKQIHSVVYPVNQTTKKNVFSIHLLNSEEIELEGETAGVWAARINKRIKDSLEDIGRNIYSKEIVHMSGKLLKSSHNKYQKALQERFVKIQGRQLLYYRNELDEKEAGSINLDTCDFIRPYDRTPQCCMFELFDEGRLYGFQATSNAEMNRWITVIGNIRDAVQEAVEITKITDSKAKVPYRVNLFINQSIDDYLFHIEHELKYIYPEEYEPPEDEEDEEDEEMRKQLEEMKSKLVSNSSGGIEEGGEGDNNISTTESDKQHSTANVVGGGDVNLVNIDNNDDIDIDANESKANTNDKKEEVGVPKNDGNISDDSSDGGASEDDECGNDEKENSSDADNNDGTSKVKSNKSNKDGNDEDEDEDEIDGGKRGEEKEEEEVVKRSLKENLDLAKAAVEFMHDLIDEDVKYDTKNGIRYDIFSIVLLEVNLFLNLRLSHVIDENSKQFKDASIADVYAFIEWLSKYQIFQRRSKCVLPPDSIVHEYLGDRPPNYCPLFEKLPLLCTRYVDGTAPQLVDHCIKVWEKFLEAPGDCLERHKDGSFYTHTPVDIWGIMNHHISLAKATKSHILHIMIADKVAAALTILSSTIETFVAHLDTDSDIVLKEIELEFLCALANNNALHIEEICSMVEHFESDELRAKVDEIFDPVTSALVICGDRCLRKIALVVMKDLEEQFSQIFSHDWVEGSHLKTITATCSDYINDLDSFLMAFWSEKFVNILLEACVLRYIRAILFNKNRVLKPPTQPKRKESFEAPPPPPPKVEESLSASFLGWGNKMKAMALKAVASVQESVEEVQKEKSFIELCKEDEVYTIADAESLGRLASDVNVLNGFFSQKADQETATILLEIVNEVSLYLFVPYDQISTHALARIAEFPTSAKAIFEVARHCMMVREDITYEDYIGVIDMLNPAVEVAPASSTYNAENGIPEGRLGLLYADLVQGQRIEGFTQTEKSATENSLAERLKMMAGVPLLALKQALAEEEDDEDGDDYDDNGEGGGGSKEEKADRERRAAAKSSRLSAARSDLLKRRSIINRNADWLVDEVIDVLDKQDDEELEILRQIEGEKRALEVKRNEVGVIEFESHLEKKSPTIVAGWQSRWFKINTRDNTGSNSADVPFIYTFMWFNKKGGSIANSYTTDKIQRFSVCDCDRPLSVLTATNKVCLQSEVPMGSTAGAAVDVKEFGEKDVSSLISLKGQMYAFMITIEGKDHYLRASKVDMMLKWVNILAQVTNFKYDSAIFQWRKI